MKEIFTINEMITIVMEIVNELELNECYKSYEEDRLNLPRPITEKIKTLSLYEYQSFMEKVTKIAEEILPIKDGELNELNRCHEEIIFLVKEYFKKLC